ncbi:spermatogenesis-associated protein 1 [Tympanuchus pallidicinctus]|uniref:spermatogenesis-associated protein 1 n=1 Tax=Tympanuchus pallidicinctus TaxID=109042 RepID=UPI0022871C6A|nr:spermatogenesis-associated protein 1 [Tympanuchus pallidicinctus]
MFQSEGKLRSPSGTHCSQAQLAACMSFGQMRPQTSQLVELHVFFVPEEVWNFKLNTVSVALASKFISAGFIRVSPHTTLRMLREKLGEYLGGVAVADKFQFLKCIGKKLAVVKAKQEAELKLKSFAPPYALYPELYLLPQVDYFEDVYPLSSSTQQKHHFNAETNRYGHGSRLPNLPQQKTESKQFLENTQSSHQLENQKVYSPAAWSEKESLPILHMSHEQDHNMITETQAQFRVKDQIGSKGSLFTASLLNPVDQGTGKSCIGQKNSQHSHLSWDPKEPPAPKWNDKAKGTALTLHVNHSDEQDQNNQTHQNHMTYPKELNSRLITKVENNDHQKDGKLRGDRTQHSGILRTLEDQTTEYIHKNQRLLPHRTSKSVTVLGENLDGEANDNKQNDPTCPKEYASPSLPLLAISVSPAQVPTVQAEKNKMVEQLEQMKKDRRLMEKNREELVKKVKTLLEQNKLKRYHDREKWKKKYFEAKKATVSLEDVLSKLGQDLDLCHQKLLLQLEARYCRKQPNNATNMKNNRIIQITTVQHELDQLKRKLDDTKMKLVIEIKMRKQAIADLRALRAELTQKKIHSALILQSGKSGI